MTTSSPPRTSSTSPWRTSRPERAALGECWLPRRPPPRRYVPDLVTDVHRDLLQIGCPDRSLVGDLRIPTGVLVVARAADLIGPESGLKTGDVIHSVNNTAINSLDSLRAALQKIKSPSPVVLQIERDGGLMWLGFELE